MMSKNFTQKLNKVSRTIFLRVKKIFVKFTGSLGLISTTCCLVYFTKCYLN